MHSNSSFSDLYERKRYVEAHNLCDGAIRDDECDYRAYHNKAKLFARERKWEEAFSLIDKAISINKEPVFFFNKARWLLELGYFDNVIECAESGIQVGIDNSYYYYEESLYLLKAYSELQLNLIDDCLTSLKNVRGEVSIRIDRKMCSKEDIVSSISK
ncbi:MAG: tetratricopeptide repeat protein [Alphaproteobacteria bacterium]